MTERLDILGGRLTFKQAGPFWVALWLGKNQPPALATALAHIAWPLVSTGPHAKKRKADFVEMARMLAVDYVQMQTGVVVEIGHHEIPGDAAPTLAELKPEGNA